MNQQQFAAIVGSVMFELTHMVNEQQNNPEGVFVSLATVVSTTAWNNLPMYVAHSFASPDHPEPNLRGAEIQYVMHNKEIGVVLHPNFTLSYLTQMFVTVGFEPDAEPKKIAKMIYEFVFENKIPDGYTFPTYSA